MIRRVSISTTIFAPKGRVALPLPDCINILDEVGYQYVELSRNTLHWAACASHIQRSGLSVWAVHGTLDAKALSRSRNERRRAVTREIRTMEEAATYSPCPYVVHYLDCSFDPEVKRWWYYAVEELLRKAEDLELTLAIEILSPNVKKRERYADSQEIAGFVQAFQSEYLGVCVDLNHSNIEENLTDVASNFKGLISNIHVSDNHGLEEQHLPPGQGAIDFLGALRSLSSAGYEGPLNLEVHLQDFPTVENLRNLKAWAEKMVVAVGRSACGKLASLEQAEDP